MIIEKNYKRCWRCGIKSEDTRGIFTKIFFVFDDFECAKCKKALKIQKLKEDYEEYKEWREERDELLKEEKKYV